MKCLSEIDEKNEILSFKNIKHFERYVNTCKMGYVGVSIICSIELTLNSLALTLGKVDPAHFFFTNHPPPPLPRVRKF